MDFYLRYEGNREEFFENNTYVINLYFSTKHTMSCKKPWGLLLSPSKKSSNLDFMTAFTTSGIFGSVIILPRKYNFFWLIIVAAEGIPLTMASSPLLV